MSDWLKYLKDFGSAIVEGSTYDPEGTIGRYMAGLEPIDGESPVTAPKESRLNKKEFADRNWMLGYAPFAAVGGAAALPYLAPGTAGGTAIGKMAGGMLVGEGVNELGKLTTGKTFGENVLNAIGYKGGDGFYGDLYRAGTELLNPGYMYLPLNLVLPMKSFVKALPLLFRSTNNGKVYSTIFGPTPLLFENFDKAFVDGIVLNPDWIKSTTLLNDKLKMRLLLMIENGDYDSNSNIPLLHNIQKNLAEAFYKLKRKTLTKRGRLTPELKLLLLQFDDEAQANLARFNDSRFYISPYNIEELTALEISPVVKTVVNRTPQTIEEATLLFLTHTNPRLALTDAIEAGNTKITDNWLINDIKLGLRNGDYIARKGNRLVDNETLGGYDWNYGRDYSRFLHDLNQYTNLRGFHLYGDNSNYITRFGIDSDLGIGHTAGKYPLSYGTDISPSNIFEWGNKHIANLRFKTVLGSKSYMDYIDGLNLKFVPVMGNGTLENRAVLYGTNNSTYTFAKELQASLYNYLRHSLGRLITVPEWQLFIESISLDKNFLNELIRNLHGGRYELIDTGATPEDYIKLFSLYKQGGKVKRRILL